MTRAVECAERERIKGLELFRFNVAAHFHQHIMAGYYAAEVLMSSNVILPSPIPDGPRRRAHRSTELLSEYLALYHPQQPTWYELRLGPLRRMVGDAHLPTWQQRMLRAWNAYADAVVATDTELLVIEAAVEADAGKISQVELYLSLIDRTPELAGYLSLARVPAVLFATDKPEVRELAEKHGVRYIYYPAPWAAEYLTQKYYKQSGRPRIGPPPQIE